MFQCIVTGFMVSFAYHLFVVFIFVYFSMDPEIGRVLGSKSHNALEVGEYRRLILLYLSFLLDV